MNGGLVWPCYYLWLAIPQKGLIIKIPITKMVTESGAFVRIQLIRSCPEILTSDPTNVVQAHYHYDVVKIFLHLQQHLQKHRIWIQEKIA